MTTGGRPCAQAPRRSSRASRAAIDARPCPRLLSPAARARAERFISNRSRRTRHYHQEPSDFHYPGLPETEFHDREQFPGLPALEAGDRRHPRRVRRADRRRGGRDGALHPISRARSDAAVEGTQSQPRTGPRSICSRTASRSPPMPDTARKRSAAIAGTDQPQVPGASPNAMFSLLAPHTRIPPHTGVANTRLVCHLPLIVPPNCGFRCRGNHSASGKSARPSCSTTRSSMKRGTTATSCAWC